jgi:hypothetical protein
VLGACNGLEADQALHPDFDLGSEMSDGLADDLAAEVAAGLPAATPACDLPPGVTIQGGYILLEDDMVLGTEDELDALCDRMTTSGLGINPGNRWPGGVVPYRIDPQLRRSGA